MYFNDSLARSDDKGGLERRWWPVVGGVQVLQVRPACQGRPGRTPFRHASPVSDGWFFGSGFYRRQKQKKDPALIDGVEVVDWTVIDDDAVLLAVTMLGFWRELSRAVVQMEMFFLKSYWTFSQRRFQDFKIT